MKNHQILLVLVPLLAFLLARWTAPPERTAFADLKVGGTVGLKDLGDSYQLTVWSEDLPQSHKVVEIGQDFVVLQDVAEVTKITIPMYSIKSVIRLQTP